jgi:hypothetical protein
MTDQELRLECIRLAAQHAPFKPEYVVSLANDYYQWVTGKTDITVKLSGNRRL